MGAPTGNANAAKQKRLLTDALKRELTQRPQDVLAIANKLIESAKAGEAWAMSLIHDRVDGKAPQPIVGDDDLPPIQVSKVERVILRANATDPNG
jgi:hypothetical protein